MKEITSILSHPKYRSDIDGLRAVAVLAVVACHTFPNRLSGGFIGVDIFFVISGFLISTIIFENLKQGTFRFTEFYSRRIRRIFPALITILVSVLVIGWFLLIPEELNELGRFLAAGAGFVTNFTLQEQKQGYFGNSSQSNPLLHLWSLGVEEQFYIVWPIFLWFAWKCKLNQLKFIVIIAFVSFAINIYGAMTNPAAIFYLPQTRFWELMCGSILAWLVINKHNERINQKIEIYRKLTRFVHSEYSESNFRTFPNVLSLLGVFLILFGFVFFDSSMIYPGLWAVIPVLGTVLIILAGPGAWINNKVLSQKVLVWFGLISFPLYLWHWPLISFAWIINPQPPSASVRAVAVFLAIVLAWLTTILIEKPLRYGNLRIPLKVVSLCATTILIVLVGFALSHMNLSQPQGTENSVTIQKRGKIIIGSSITWYQGKDNWLFLGDKYNESVAKLTLAKVPSIGEVAAVENIFSAAAAAAADYNSKLVFIMGPNKENIYSEYLPDIIQPATKKYSSFFLNKLDKIPNLTVYDPTNDLLLLKKSEGLLYSKTDTHWNSKGAFLTFRGFLKQFSVPIPKVDFRKGAEQSGDLIELSKLQNRPFDSKDNWTAVWKDQQILSVTPPKVETHMWSIPKLSRNLKKYFAIDYKFGQLEQTFNFNPLSEKHVWVLGDSFSHAMKEFFDNTFKEVTYIGGADKISQLPYYLEDSIKKPEIIVVIKVERSF